MVELHTRKVNTRDTRSKQQALYLRSVFIIGSTEELMEHIANPFASIPFRQGFYHLPYRIKAVSSGSHGKGMTVIALHVATEPLLHIGEAEAVIQISPWAHVYSSAWTFPWKMTANINTRIHYVIPQCKAKRIVAHGFCKLGD